jgi:DNA replication protein DnaC
MKSLKEILQSKIPAHLAQSDLPCNYKEVLTQEEIEHHLSYELDRKKKHYAYRMAGLNINRLEQKMSEKKWELTDEEKETILQQAANRKLWHLQDQRDKELKRQQMLDKRKQLLKTWTAEEFMRLIRTHYISKHSQFIENSNQQNYFKALSYFLSGDPLLEKEMGFSSKKGLLILGESGMGKTETLKAVKSNPVTPLTMFSMIEVAGYIRETGSFDLPLDRIIVLDDVGCEPVPIKYYGTDIRWFADFIEDRYINQESYSNLIITTNYGGDQIQELYGYRVRSRLREMFNVIELKGTDLRK